MFADVTRADERTLRFAPGGLLLDRRLRPDDAVAVQRMMIADAVLVEAVPGTVRQGFERLRRKQTLGVVDYEQFTEVAQDAIGWYEPALRARFTEFYRDQEIPFVDADGHPLPIITNDYREIARHIRAKRPRLVSTAGARVRFGGMLSDLLWWARETELLRGQRARCDERRVVKIRNQLSHDRSHQILTPVKAARAFHDLAEFINQLWGTPTADGRVYPAPVTRDVLAVGYNRATGENAVTHAYNLSPDEDPAWIWLLLRGLFHDEVIRFDARYVTTRVPAEYLWGPCTGAEAVQWLTIHQPLPDQVDPIDRLYVLRHHGTNLYLPQTPEIFAATPPKEQDGTWALMRADTGNDAFTCARTKADGEHAGECGCPAQTVERGPWHRVQRRLAELQPNLTPTLYRPPDVRALARISLPRQVQVATEPRPSRSGRSPQ